MTEGMVTGDMASGGGLSGLTGTAVRPITAVRWLLGSQPEGNWNGSGPVGYTRSIGHDLASDVEAKM